jgi:protoheme IX farnesyltransferase
VIGGAAGAFPPMVAYAAITGTISLSSLALFALIFIWTPPHFWALALVKSEEYAKAGIPMLPTVAGPDRTRRDILLYTLLLVPAGTLPYLMGFASAFYGLLSAALGLCFLVLAVRVYRNRTGDIANKIAMDLFKFSILYLFLLFSALILEKSLVHLNVLV